jgi:hypothetical protein
VTSIDEWGVPFPAVRLTTIGWLRSPRSGRLCRAMVSGAAAPLRPLLEPIAGLSAVEGGHYVSYFDVVEVHAGKRALTGRAGAAGVAVASALPQKV